MASVFLSYDRDDAGKARPIAIALEKAGHSVWWDERIGGGSQYAKEIELALNRSDIVVVLWSTSSVESPWVRDEAGTGRDKGRLVPLSVDGTSPPLGFRQFQTVDLGTWSGRGKVPKVSEILAAIDTLMKESAAEPEVERSSPPHRSSGQRTFRGRLILASLGLVLLASIAIGTWWWFRSDQLMVVEVAAANSSPRTQAAASDLFVKLGSLAQLGQSKWQLVNSNADRGRSSLIFRVADTGSSVQPQANLVLLDGRSDALLWSREFDFPQGQQADLRQQLSLAAGRVLECAMESREQGGLSTDLLKLFLDSCAPRADQDADKYGPAAQLRRIVSQVPSFRPGWSRLILAEATAVDISKATDSAETPKRQLKADVDRVRKMFPDLPELAIAELRLQNDVGYGRDLAILDAAVDRNPDNPLLLSEQSEAQMRVGRMFDAIGSAHKAAELDPLSPRGTAAYIMSLAYGGQVDTARAELNKAEKLWAGTEALKETEIAFLSRFGDPAKAFELDPEGYNTGFYYKARKNPSPANIARLKAGIDEFRPKQVNASQVAWAIQGLAEFGLVDDVFYWLGRLSNDEVAGISYVLFRPALASVRRDPRFMPLAFRIGLVRYWRTSGIWPDFCERPGIPYDCKAVAAKLK